MFANFLIGLREGLEAALIVAILVAYLVKLDQRSVLPRLWTGVGLAIGLSILTIVVLTVTGNELSDKAAEAFAGIMSLVAVGLITWMIFWMATKSRTIKAHLEGEVDKALLAGGAGLTLVAFVAVAREGLETALFVWTAAKSSGTTTGPVIGAALGLGLAVLLGILMYRGAMRVNLRALFAWTGGALVIVAAGMLTYAVHEFQEVGWLPGKEAVAFDISGPVPPDSIQGTLLRGIFNISPVSSWLEVAVWFAYAIPVMTAFLLVVLRQPARPAAPAKTKVAA